MKTSPYTTTYATLEFSANFDTMFDFRGITIIPSGTAPHHPDQPRIVIANAEPMYQLHSTLCAAAATAASSLTLLHGFVDMNVAGADDRTREQLEELK